MLIEFKLNTIEYTTLTTLPPKPTPPTPPTPPQISCPKCNSTQITANKKGFGVGKAIAGAVVTGGVGLLAGFMGSGNIKITCLNCGHSWKAGKR
jgi:hypothetical protein